MKVKYPSLLVLLFALKLLSEEDKDINTPDKGFPSKSSTLTFK